MRVGLCLGAGGIVGASYLCGALEGVRRSTGFTPSDARIVLGTSAGAFMGALSLTTSVPLLYTHCTGIEAPGAPLSSHEHERASRLDRHNHGSFLRRYPPVGRMPRPFLSSSATVRRSIVDREARSAELLATGLLGEGWLSSQSVGSIVAEASDGVWPTTRFGAVALDLDAGSRLLLTRDAAPRVRLADAVRASMAVPALFAPVEVSGLRLVDGGTWSTTNLDLLEHEPLDAVLAIVPMGGAPTARGPVDYLRGMHRRRVDAQLRRECGLLEARGIRTLVLAPNADEVAALPLNFLDFASRESIVRHAAESVAARLAPGGDSASIGAFLKGLHVRPRETCVS